MDAPAHSDCPFCGLPGPEVDLSCANCGGDIPFDIATGGWRGSGDGRCRCVRRVGAQLAVEWEGKKDCWAGSCAHKGGSKETVIGCHRRPLGVAHPVPAASVKPRAVSAAARSLRASERRGGDDGVCP